MCTPRFLPDKARSLVDDAAAMLNNTLACTHTPNTNNNPTNNTKNNRFLPDKAIDLVDEAAAKLKMEITSKPEALDEIDRKVLQLEMERLSLGKVRKETGTANEGRFW